MSVRFFLARHRAMAGFVSGVAATSLLGSGVALASIPSTATGSITGCVNRTSGALRVVDFQAGKRCSSRETTIFWTKGYRYRGPWSSRAAYGALDVVSYLGSSYVAKVPSTGRVPGSLLYWGTLATRGATGLRGAAGPAGVPGLPGALGPAGAAGAVGPAGPDGALGAAGADGAAGAIGPMGPMGPQGPAGAVGATGAAGPAGATGPAGAAGAAGPQGPAGVLGRVVVTVTADVPANSHTLLDPQCPTGTIPISGGAHVGSQFAGWGSANVAYIAESDLDQAGTGWSSTAVTTASADPSTHFVAHVICVSAS